MDDASATDATDDPRMPGVVYIGGPMSKLTAMAACAALVGGCGFKLRVTEGDAGALTDAEPDAPPVPLTVQVTAPNGGETVYPAEPFTIAWTAGGAASYDVELVDGDGAGEATAIASGVTDTSIAWTPSGVAVPTTFRIRVVASNDTGGTATDESDAAFTLSPPLTGTSLARDVQPIFTGKCLTQFCHTRQTQAAQLDLTAGATYGELVGVNSIENPCTSYLRVRPGNADLSYLMIKVVGSGPCFFGVRMPKSAAALPASEIATIRAWIAEGALDN